MSTWRSKHEDHPGSCAEDCPLRITINTRSGMSQNGFACDATGGHCIPSDYCDEYRKDHRNQCDLEKLLLGLENE